MQRIAWAFAVVLCLPISVWAESDFSNWSVPVSASVGLGQLESSGSGLSSRNMNALSLEALPAFNIGSWRLGAHLDYRVQGQLTSASSVDNTNLKGQMWLVGFGARYDFSSELFAQISTDFFGAYNFDKEKANGDKHGLKEPIGVRFKVGKSFLENYPRLSFDADVQYLKFQKAEVAGVTTAVTSTQWFVGLGVTYIFGDLRAREKAQPISTPVVLAPLEQKSLLPEYSFAFGPHQSSLSDKDAEELREIASLIAKSQVEVSVSGHSDTSGRAKENKRLAKERAQYVSKILVEQGVESARIKTRSFGSAQPRANNNSAEGRQMNRRVDITFGSKD